MNFFQKLFGTVPAPTARAADVLDVNDELNASGRLNDKLEARLTKLRAKLVDLEEIEGDSEERIRVMEKTHATAMREAEDNSEVEIRVAKTQAQEQIRTLEESLAQLTSDKKIKEQEIEHMVRMANESKDLEVKESKMVETERANKAIQKATDEFNTKLTAVLEKQIKDGDERFAQILAQLPDTKVRLKGEL